MQSGASERPVGKSRATAAVAAGGSSKGDGAVDEGFLRRTYRSTLLLTGVGLLYLWAYQWTWAMLPLASGAALALAMLGANDLVAKRFLPGVAEETRKNRGDGRAGLRALAGVALVKYLLVAPVLWLLVRWWSLNELAAFAFGVSLVPTNIVLRVVGRCLAAASPRSVGRTRGHTT
jgi:hypothetical protein